MRARSYHGLLVLDKPGGMTSRDAVDRAQRWFPRGTRIGHTGTLDPLATGVLALCVGAATRLTEYVQVMAKTYRAGVLLGARSDTDDADGTITPVVGAHPPDRAALERVLAEFVGEITQVPPAYSAAKVAGRRAYDLARRGLGVSLEARRVRVYGIDVLAYEYPRLQVEVRCGKGTYIRSLARDLGDRLGCGALIETLRRTRVGPFEAGTALRPEADAAAARAALLPPSAAVSELPRVTLAPAEVSRLRRGQAVSFGAANPAESLFQATEVAVFDQADDLVAVAGVDRRCGTLRPGKVIPAPATGSRRD
jgi:tRNA pseudouridine55 synthase